MPFKFIAFSVATAVDSLIRLLIVLFPADHRTAGKSKRSQVVEKFGVPDGI